MPVRKAIGKVKWRKAILAKEESNKCKMVDAERKIYREMANRQYKTVSRMDEKECSNDRKREKMV